MNIEQPSETIPENLDESLETPQDLHVETVVEMVNATPVEVAPAVVIDYSLDIDFETYVVPEDRAGLIREQIKTFKEKAWLQDAFDWVKAVGENFNPHADAGELLSENSAQKLRLSNESGEHFVELILDGSDLEIRPNSESFLICQKLPKGDELLISFFAPECLDAYTRIENLLHSEVRAFTKGKSEKSKLIQEKLAARAAAKAAAAAAVESEATPLANSEGTASA